MDNVVCLGMACRVPNADNVEEFWTQLANGIDAIGEISSRWPCGLYGLPSRMGLLKDITRFDSEFFYIPEEKVETMDPQLRMVLEVSTEAIMDSAISPNVLSDLKTGVYTTMLNSEVERIGFHVEDSSTGIIAKHLAKHFNLNGPSIGVDCACSSALQALLIAKTDIMCKRADFALVTGCSLLLSPNQSVQNLMLGMLSSDGTCRAWDSDAKGYVRSEGIFAVVLGRYPSSIFYPRIYAHIIAGASNSDGCKSEGITFPSRKMQQELLEKIYKSDIVRIQDVVYIECHATGTPAGDPEELAALCSLLTGSESHSLLVGSCKTNIGHTEWAAGLASLIKVLLCIQNSKIPGNLHFNKPHPAIYGFSNGLLIPVTSLTPLPHGNIGISGMGFGGSNCHLVIKPPKQSTGIKIQPKVVLMLIGSRTKDGLIKVKNFLSRSSSLEIVLLINQMFSYHALHLPYQEMLLLEKVNGFYNKELSKIVIDNFSENKKEKIWLILHDIAIIEDLTSEFDVCQIYLINQVTSHWLQDPEILKLSSVCPLLHHLIHSAVIMLGVVEALKICGIEVGGIVGCGLSEILALIIQEDCLTAVEGLKLIETFYRVILSNAPDIEKYESITVEASLSLINTICKDFIPICHYSENCVLISGSMEVMKSNKLLLETNKIKYQETILFHCHLYTSLLKQCIKELKNELRCGMTSGKCRWNNWISTLVPKHDKKTFLETEKADYNYFSQIAHKPVYLHDAMTAIPPNSFKVHVGRGIKPQWVSEFDLFINVVSGIETLIAFASIYKEGFKLDISKLQPLTESVPVSTPSVGQLMQWNHELSWAPPHWKQFSFTVRDEESSKYFLFETPEASLPLLLEISLNKIKNIQKQVPAAVEFYNLSTICKEFDENKPLGIQFLTGVQRFEIRQGTRIIFRGHYKIMDQPIESPKMNSENLNTGNLECWEAPWQDSWSIYLKHVYSRLSSIYHELSLVPLSVTFYLGTGQPGNTNTLVSLEKVTGLCLCGNILKIILPSLEIKSNESDVTFNLKTPMNIDSKTANFTFKEEGGITEIIKPLPIPTNVPCCQAVSLLVPALLSWHIQKHIELNCQITEKTTILVLADCAESMVQCILHMFQQMPSQLIVCVKRHLLNSDISLDHEVKETGMNKIANLLNTSESTVFLSPNLLPPENLQMKFVEEVVSTPEQNNYQLDFTPSPIDQDIEDYKLSIPVEKQNISDHKQNKKREFSALETKYYDHLFSDTNVLCPYISSGSQSFIQSTPGSTENRSYKDVLSRCHWLPLHPFSKTQIRMITDSKGVDAIISLHAGFLQWLDILTFNGDIFHLGEIELDMSSVVPPNTSSWSIVCHNPLEIITNIGTKFQDSQKIDIITTDTMPTSSYLWSMLCNIGFSAQADAEQNSLYRSSEFLVLLASLNLSTVQKKILKNFKDLVSEDNVAFSQGLQWLRDLCSTPILNRGFNLQMPVYSGSQGGPGSVITSAFRPQTPVPCVFSLTPELEQQEKVMKSLIATTIAPDLSSPVHDSSSGMFDCFILEFVSPLSRPSLPALVALNTVVCGQPLFLIHPITGVLNLLRNLGRSLPFPCFGIQQTDKTPKNSLHDLANYYLNEILNHTNGGSLCLCGYSFGACVAFAIALEAQRRGLEVEHLILLDGSPHYIKMPLDIIRQSYTKNQVEKILEAEILLAFLQLYGAVDVCAIRPLLVEAETLEERFNTAVDFLMNTQKKESSLWQRTIQLSEKEMSTTQCSLYSTSQKLIRMKHLSKANVFFDNIKMADDWKIPETKFKGDIHLLRVQNPPDHCSTIPLDYGLAELVTGEVNIRAYQCSHEAIVAPTNLPQLINDLIEILT